MAAPRRPVSCSSGGHRHVTAIFAFNDQMAIGAIGALQRAGRRVPEDVSVVGFDDIPQAAAIFPALTTIAQPIAEMGTMGVRLLLDRIARDTRGHAPYQRVRLADAAGRAGEHGAARDGSRESKAVSRQDGET